MNINANNSNFYFELPKGFLYPEVDDMFKDSVKKLTSTTMLKYDTSLKYLNSTISGITIPGINTESVSQIIKKEPVQWKGGGFLHRGIDKEFDVTFSLTDGFINWMMLLVNMEYYLRSDKEFFPDFYINILNSENYNIFTIRYSQVQMTDIPSQDLSWTNNTFDNKSFNLKFKFNQMELKFNID